MKSYSYEVRVCYNRSRFRAPELAASRGNPGPFRRNGPAIGRDQLAIQMPLSTRAPAHLGVTSEHFLYDAYHGMPPYKYLRTNLRLLKNDFAKCGNRKGSNLPHWLEFSTDSQTAMELNSRVGSMPLAKPARLKFLLEYFGADYSKQSSRASKTLHAYSF